MQTSANNLLLFSFFYSSEVISTLTLCFYWDNMFYKDEQATNNQALFLFDNHLLQLCAYQNHMFYNDKKPQDSRAKPVVFFGRLNFSYSCCPSAFIPSATMFKGDHISIYIYIYTYIYTYLLHICRYVYIYIHIHMFVFPTPYISSKRNTDA